MRLSAPPASTTSASPRATSRNASPTAWVPATQAVVTVLFGPWALNVIEMWAATMFGRCFSSHSGNSGVELFVVAGWSGRTSRPRLDDPLEHRHQLGQVHRHDPGAHDDADPLGVLVLHRDAAVLDGQARGPDAEPGGPAHHLHRLAHRVRDERRRVEVVDLAGDLDREGGGVERGIARTPLRPLTHASQNASLPTPFGATTPSPVTTTRRMDSEPPSPRMPRLPVQLRYRPWYGWGENVLPVRCFDHTTDGTDGQSPRSGLLFILTNSRELANLSSF